MKKAIKIILTVILFAVIALFVYRCYMVADHSYGGTPYVTEALKSAFADDESEILKSNSSGEISESGLFAAYNMFYNPESGEVQVTVRWNKSTYEKTSTPDGEDFDFVIKNETTGEEFPCTIIESHVRSLYRYRRLIAKAVIGDSDRVTIEMVKSGDSQLLKHESQPLGRYKMSGKLHSALTE